jgi:putative NADH-flavin reductase
MAHTVNLSVALFGITGRTGLPLAKRLLSEGIAVRGLARTPEKISLQDERLTIVKGDALNAQAVRAMIDGADIVVSTLGQGKGSPPTLLTDATRNILQAMREAGTQRIISLTGGGVPFEKDQPKIADNLIRFIMRTFTKDLLNDAIAHAELIRTSGLTWTIVRAPRLTNDPAKGSYRVGWVGVNASTVISRNDLADFMFREIQSPQHTGTMPFVSY